MVGVHTPRAGCGEYALVNLDGGEDADRAGAAACRPQPRAGCGCRQTTTPSPTVMPCPGVHDEPAHRLLAALGSMPIFATARTGRALLPEACASRRNWRGSLPDRLCHDAAWQRACLRKCV